MRQATATAPNDGRIVILEDNKTRSCGIHWARDCALGRNGKPGEITPTHRHPTPGGKYRPRNDGGSSKVLSARSSASWRGACHSAPVMMTAVLLALFFAVTLDTAQSGTIDIARIGERPVGLAELEGAYAEIAPRVEAENGQTSTSEDASQVQQVAATAVQVAQQSQKDGRAQAPVQELTEARLTIEGLEGRLRAEAAKSARLVEEEREKSAALAKETAAARQELSAATAKHRQALAEERESRASLLATAAMKYRQELNAERERHTVLISEIAAVRREIEVQAAKFRQAGAETARLTQADATKTPQLPELGCGNTAALAQEAAAARQELTTNVEKQRQALDEERARSRALASELAKAQREIETQAVQRNASEETRRLRQPKSVTSTQSLDPAAREKATLARKAAAAR
jgi:hypothetical protein